MKSLHCIVIYLSCITNWFALAYRPLGSPLSKKVLEQNSMIRVLSGFMHSVSTSSLTNLHRKEFNVNMVASTFRGGGNDDQVLFDASLFLNWWPAGKKSAEQVTFDSKRFASGTKLNLMEYSQEELEINLVTNMGSDLLSDAKSKASASTTVIKSSINSPSFLAGYMDFDPMVAATRSHTSNSNRKSSWFSRSD